MLRRPVAFVNARIVTPAGEAQTMRVARRILGFNGAPRAGDTVCDLDGAWVLPGLINAHDHLELNHYGAQHGRRTGGNGAEPYRNVREWVDDMRPRLRADAAIAAGRARPLAARLWLGGFKNLLAGVTLVAHHNPFYAGLQRTSPVRVLRRFGWAHSLGMEQAPVGAQGEPGGVVAERHRATPADVPFVLHAAEGVDAEARREVSRLNALGALAPNTVLVHAVGLDPEGWRLAGAHGVSVVWCPASNLALFGATLDIGQARAAVGGCLALGTDSRLTGARDLLDELRLAAGLATLSAAERLAMVTSAPASMLRCAPAGQLSEGGPADLIVIPAASGHPGDALTACRRADLRLVMAGGRPKVAAPGFAPLFEARRVKVSGLRVDGVSKIADAAIVRALHRHGIDEPGVEAG